MSASRRVFVDYLSSVESNAWLSFARGLFNRTTDSAGVQHLLFHGAADQRFQTITSSATDRLQSAACCFNLSVTAAHFASFVDVQEVEQIQLWSRQFWER